MKTLNRVIIYIGIGIGVSVGSSFTLMQQEMEIRQHATAIVEKLIDKEAELRRDSINALQKLTIMLYQRVHEEIQDLRNNFVGR